MLLGLAASALLPPPASLSAQVATIVVGSPAGVIRPLTGINVGPLGTAGNPPLVDAYRARGVRLIRTHDFYGPLDLATMFPDRTRDPSDPDAYVFTRPVGRDGRSSDEVFAAIVDHGFEPYFRLGDSYNNARAPAAGEVDRLSAAAVQVVRHYRDGLWNGFHTAFRYVEIWNEPDSRQFWAQPAGLYHDFYVRTAHALRAALPDLAIGGPGVTPAGCLAPSGQAFTRDFLSRVSREGAPLDFFSWHLYANSPDDYDRCAAFFRRVLDEFGFAHVPMHVTEWNTEGGAGADRALRTGAQGAAVNTAAWIAMQHHGVAESLFYRGPDPSLDLPTFFGMFFADGRPKAVGHAAELWAAMSAYPLRRDTEVSASDLHVVTGANLMGGLAVLVANLSPVQRGWTLDAGAAVPVETPALVRTVSDSSTGSLTETVRGRTFSLPPYGVQLVTLQPPGRSLELCTPGAGAPAPARPGVAGPAGRIAAGYLDARGGVSALTPVLDSARSPDAVRLPDGRLLVYYVNETDGALWVATLDHDAAHPVGPVMLNGRVAASGLADPDAVSASGRVRLSYLADDGRSRAVCAAESDDGVRFNVVGEALAVPDGEGWRAPSAVPLREGRWLLAVTDGTRVRFAGSAEGYAFAAAGTTVAGTGSPELVRLADGRLALYLCGRGLQRFVSTDEGQTWSDDGLVLDHPAAACKVSVAGGTTRLVLGESR